MTNNWNKPVEWSEEIPDIPRPLVPTVEQVLAQMIFVSKMMVANPECTRGRADYFWSEKPNRNTLSETGRDEYQRQAHKLILLLAEHNIYLSR